MDENNVKILYELLQNATSVNKSLISSEIAMNDGDIKNCQKYTKECVQLLTTMVGDVFEEFEEQFKISEKGTNAYEIPTNLELARQTALLSFDISMLLSMSIEKVGISLLTSTENAIAKDINTIKEIYNAIYAN